MQRRPEEEEGGASWPDADGHRLIFLLDAVSRSEERLLRRWIEEHRPPHTAEAEAVPLTPSRRRRRRDSDALEAALGRGDDPLCVPLRVIWDRAEVPAGRPNPLREIFTIGDPRDPGRLRERWLHFRHPERRRVVRGEPARLSELRERWLDRGGRDPSEVHGLSRFVELQAQFALERAERRARGSRYKVPRLVAREILGRPGFRAGVARLAGELQLPEKKVERRAAACLHEMAASHRRQFIELSAQLIHMLYTRGYEEALAYDHDKLEEIYALAQRHPVVFLPSHKSNLDHLVLQYALHENGHPPNHTAGGINMNFFPVGPIMRRAGIVFIRRSFQDDPVYKFVIRQYVDYLVEKRFTLEWYIEGGRSRTGKLLPPRMGMLAYVADAYRRGKSEDVLLVPVSIAYDQIQDVGDYVAEQSGAKKKKESFGWFLGVIRSVQRRFGRIHIGFGEPVSLREHLGPPLPGHKPDPDAESIATRKLAFEVSVRINRETPITPTSLLTFALLGIGDQAATARQISFSLGPLARYVEERGFPVTEAAAFDSPDAVAGALHALSSSGVVTCFAEGPEPVYLIAADQYLTAAYYRNTIIHFFVAGAIAELALLEAVEAAEGDRMTAFEDAVAELRDLFKFEFFFPEKDEFRREVSLELGLRAPGWEDAVANGPDAIRAVLRSLRPLLAHRVLRAFLSAYHVVADEIAAMDDVRGFDEAAFLVACAHRGRQYLLQHRLRSAESVSQPLFVAALGLARNRGLLDADNPERVSELERFASRIARTLHHVEAISALGSARRAGLIR